MSRILVLTSREIYPTHGGDKLRIFKICEYLSKYHTLDVVSLTEKKEYNYNKHSKVKSIFDSATAIYHSPLRAKMFSMRALFSNKSMQEWYYYNPELFDLLQKKKEDYDFVLIHLFRMEQYAELFDPSKVHVELTDAISMNYSRLNWYSIRSLMEAFYYLDRNKILNRELQILSKYHSVSLISNTDKAYLKQHKPTSNIRVFKNGVNLERFQMIDKNREGNIVFIGNINSTQNRDACNFFINEILPEINGEFPNIKFKIVGLISEQLKKSFEENSNVIVTGKVDSIQKAVGNPVAGVCPMRYGAGIQNKILEYLAMGIPVISSKMGMEGLENLQENIYQAETPLEYFDSLNKILFKYDKEKTDPNILRKCVKDYYSWQHRLEGFEELFNFELELSNY